MSQMRGISTLTLTLLVASAALADGPTRLGTAAAPAVSADAMPALQLADAAPRLEALPVAFACPSCDADAKPVVTLLWLEDGQQRGVLSVVDWAEGTFQWSPPVGAEDVVLSGEPRAEEPGWTVLVPLHGRGAPFRVVGSLEGHAAARNAFWPARAPDVVTEFAFTPLHELLLAHPEWSPATTEECDVLVPKSTEPPIVFFAGEAPRAWITPGDEDAEGQARHGLAAWTFQFVRPGSSLLERVSLEVIPSDEGEHWAFRLPLQAVLGDGGHGMLAAVDGVARPDVTASALRVSVSNLGTLDLGACPRVPVPAPRIELDTAR